jgi:hypothetical protein
MQKIIFLLIIIYLSACSKKQNNQSTLLNLPSANASLVNITINQNAPGYVIPFTFQGLSYETGFLAKTPKFLVTTNTVLIQLIKNLGPGLLRIGGNSSDGTYWTSIPRNSKTGTDSLSTTDIDSVASFATAINWPVLFGLNLGSSSTSVAGDEAVYATKSFKNNLYAFQIGNEPDLFSNNGHRTTAYNYSAYQTEWNSYFTVVKSVVPQASFAGPDVAVRAAWITSFADNENKNVKLIDGHYYRTGPSSDPSITYQTILAPANQLPNYLQTLNNASLKYNLPYRISECNSVYNGGKTGVSDVFASALWALDFMWIVAENNGQGVNFHGANGGPYSPFIQQNGLTVPRPEYYAMLAFKFGSTNGSIVPATRGQTAYNCSSYACINGGVTYITLINKEVATDISFNITTSKTANTVSITRLAAPAVTSTTNITLGGSSVNADGTYTPVAAQLYTVGTSNFIINVPAGSAAIISAE